MNEWSDRGYLAFVQAISDIVRDNPPRDVARQALGLIAKAANASQVALVIVQPEGAGGVRVEAGIPDGTSSLQNNIETSISPYIRESSAAETERLLSGHDCDGHPWIAVPLAIGGKVKAYVFVQTVVSQTPTDQYGTIPRLVRLAAPALAYAPVVRQTRQELRSERAARRERATIEGYFETIHGTLGIVRGTEIEPEFYHRYCSGIARLLEAEHATLWMIEPQHKWAILKGTSKMTVPKSQMLDLRLSEDAVIWRCIVGGQVVGLADIGDRNGTPLIDKSVAAALPHYRFQAIPLNMVQDDRERECASMVLCLFYRPDRAMDEIERIATQRMEQVARGGDVLDYALLLQESAMLREFRDTLDSMAGLGASDLGSMVDNAYLEILRFLEKFAEGVSIFRHESIAGRQVLRCRVSSGIFDERGVAVDPSKKDVTYDLEEDKVHRTVRVFADRRTGVAYWGVDGADGKDEWGRPTDRKWRDRQANMEEPPTSWMGVPIISGKRTEGVLRTTNRIRAEKDPTRSFFSDADKQVFERIAALLSLIMRIESVANSILAVLGAAHHNVVRAADQIGEESDRLSQNLRDGGFGQNLVFDVSDIRKTAMVIAGYAEALSLYVADDIHIDSPKTFRNDRFLLYCDVILPVISACGGGKTSSAARNEVDCHVDTFQKHVPRLESDQKLLLAIFHSLIHNAFKYSGFIGGLDRTTGNPFPRATKPIVIWADSDSTHFLIHIKDWGVGYTQGAVKRMGMGHIVATRGLERIGGTLCLTNEKDPTQYTVRLPRSLQAQEERA